MYMDDDLLDTCEEVLLFLEDMRTDVRRGMTYNAQAFKRFRTKIVPFTRMAKRLRKLSCEWSVKRSKERKEKKKKSESDAKIKF